MVERKVAALLGLWVAACGGDEGQPGGSAGVTGSAGGRSGSGGVASAGSGTGGGGGSSGSSTAGAGNGPRGAFSLHIVPGDGCSLTDQWVDFPVVEGGHPVTATETVETIDDGATGQVLNSSGTLIDTTISRLACRWGGRDPAFDFQVGFRFGPAGRDGLLSMGASITVGQTQTLGLVLQAQDWESTYSGQCTFTALEVDDATRSVRGEIVCAALEPDTVDEEVCALPNGYYAFENCTPP